MTDFTFNVAVVAMLLGFAFGLAVGARFWGKAAKRWNSLSEELRRECLWEEIERVWNEKWGQPDD